MRDLIAWTVLPSQRARYVDAAIEGLHTPYGPKLSVMETGTMPVGRRGVRVRNLDYGSERRDDTHGS